MAPDAAGNRLLVSQHLLDQATRKRGAKAPASAQAALKAIPSAALELVRDALTQAGHDLSATDAPRVAAAREAVQRLYEPDAEHMQVGGNLPTPISHP